MSTDFFDASLFARAGDGWEGLDGLAHAYAEGRRRLPPERARELRNRVIHAMLPFAGRIARRYRDSPELLEDLEQVARVGLVKAVDRYDPARGSFTAFAVLTITGELKRHFRDHTWAVRVPRAVQELVLAVRQAETALTRELGRPPTEAEVAARCRVSPEEIVDARRSGSAYRSVSLSLPVGAAGAQLADLLGDADPAVELLPDRLTLRRLMDQLPARERRILMERFYGSRTQAQIGADLGISQMHVSRLLNRTLGWLRAAMLSEQAPPWPDGASV